MFIRKTHVHASELFKDYINMSHSLIQGNVTVSEDCANGQNINASYELSYTNVNGTSCVVDTTDCRNGVCRYGVCRYELQNTTADSSCQPLFSGEDVTVSITATNIVGSSNPAMPRSISEFSGI